MLTLFAAGIASWSFAEMAIAIVVVLGLVAIVYAVTRTLGVSIPPYLIHVVWIVVVVAIAIIAIKMLASL